MTLPADRYLDTNVHPGYAPAATRKADAYLRDALDRIRAVQGVTAAGATALLPATAAGWDKVATLWDRPLPPTVSQLPQFEYRPVSGDYFAAMGIRVVQGRAFTDRDTSGSPFVVIVNEEFVRRSFHGRREEAIGKLISVNPPKRLLPVAAVGPDTPDVSAQFAIVGIVADARNAGVTQPADPMVYAPYSQGAETTLTMSFAIRTAVDPMAVLPAVRRAMWLVDPNQPLASIRTMDDALAISVGRPTIETELLVGFGGLALVLAAFGINALVAFAVAQQTREIGIRIALGAQPVAITVAVVGHSVALAITGVALGSAGALAAVRAMRSMVFGIGVVDPVVFGAIAVILVLTAALAALPPALRAASVDPLLTLR